MMLSNAPNELEGLGNKQLAILASGGVVDKPQKEFSFSCPFFFYSSTFFVQYLPFYPRFFSDLGSKYPGRLLAE